MNHHWDVHHDQQHGYVTIVEMELRMRRIDRKQIRKLRKLSRRNEYKHKNKIIHVEVRF
jgi:hypothetical protein